jgi:hypothetical protein
VADPDFPYVGKFIAKLTLAQLKTLDCGSQRQSNFRKLFAYLNAAILTSEWQKAFQLVYPDTRISTLQEVLDFVECADPEHLMRWNIESKIDAAHPSRTASVEVFVQSQHALFAASPYRHAITVSVQSLRSVSADVFMPRSIKASTGGP